MPTLTQEELIRQQLREFERGMQYQRGSRFDRLTIAGNLIDATARTQQAAGRLATRASKTRPKDRYLPTEFRTDPQYTLHVSLAPKADNVYTEPLVDPVPGVYQVRLELEQTHDGPLFQGCQLEWQVPAGWSLADGNPTITYHEFISNPIVIDRLATYASGKKGWRVVILNWYRA